MANPIILDASAWLAVLLKEEESNQIEYLLGEHSLLAPELIYYEAANGILFAKRGERTAFKSVPLEELLNFIFEFPIRTIQKDVWWEKSVEIAQNYDLTFYDSTYLACAKALDLPLLTLDKKISQVLKKEHLQTHDIK
ncbi:MAG: type II toxin-antitoxin system VapC family toxin [Elusimicrobia bacterium]|nr:type II toxin-antitoxin system VapC family toxin [Elusimicrobiota bacterium]